MTTIHVANDFSRFPTGRYKKHGKSSGEAFRDDLLLPLLKNKEPVEIILDGTSGYPASFLEEVFGGLVRKGISLNAITKLITLSASTGEYRVYADLAWRYAEDAEQSQILKGRPNDPPTEVRPGE